MSDSITTKDMRWIDLHGRDITGTDAVAGYQFHDFFTIDIADGATDAALRSAYKGRDSEGIGVSW